MSDVRKSAQAALGELRMLVMDWQYDKNCPAKVVAEIDAMLAEWKAEPQPEPLTSDQITAIYKSCRAAVPMQLAFAREIERAHGIGKS